MKPLHSSPTLQQAIEEIDKQINAYKGAGCNIKKLKKAKQVLCILTESEYQELHNQYLEEQSNKITYHPATNNYEYKGKTYETYKDAKKAMCNELTTNKQSKIKQTTQDKIEQVGYYNEMVSTKQEPTDEPKNTEPKRMNKIDYTIDIIVGVIAIIVLVLLAVQ